MVATPTDKSALCHVVAATTENPVTISMVSVTLDVMKGWKATYVRKASGFFNQKTILKRCTCMMFNVY